MKRKTRSILEEINSMSPKRDRRQLVEANAEQVIATAINLIELINETFDNETAADLNKRLINSIRTKDPRKFKRGVSKL
jgi:predicted secreted Zn-dependent protease|tara:strand:+ start:654 stop:890 length:237 start_codon:yes stop_codon:yes gene_type:complete